MWTWDSENKRMVHREIKYVPGFFKIVDEILVNAADNKVSILVYFVYAIPSRFPLKRGASLHPFMCLLPIAQCVCVGVATDAETGPR